MNRALERNNGLSSRLKTSTVHIKLYKSKFFIWGLWLSFELHQAWSMTLPLATHFTSLGLFHTAPPAFVGRYHMFLPSYSSWHLHCHLFAFKASYVGYLCPSCKEYLLLYIVCFQTHWCTEFWWKLMRSHNSYILQAWQKFLQVIDIEFCYLLEM